MSQLIARTHITPTTGFQVTIPLPVSLLARISAVGGWAYLINISTQDLTVALLPTQSNNYVPSGAWPILWLDPGTTGLLVISLGPTSSADFFSNVLYATYYDVTEKLPGIVPSVVSNFRGT